jgi:hypothetical protein
MPNPDRLLRTIDRAIELFRDTPGRVGHLVNIPEASDVLIAGDMHGNLGNFRSVLNRAALKENPKRHLVVQELVHGTFDYAVGGDKSHQLLDLISALKCEYPERVHMLLGNHELSQWQVHRISKWDRDPLMMFSMGVKTAYGERAGEIYQAYERLFAALPVAVRAPNRVFMSHSIPSAIRMERFDPTVLEKDTHTKMELNTGGTVHSLVWGRDTRLETVLAFLEKVNADLVITGHIPCDQGYDVPNERQLILDSMRQPAAYCLYPADRPITHAELLQGVALL